MNKLAVTLLVLISTALAQQPKPKLPPQHVEYDIVKDCIVKVVPSKTFHCYVGDPDHPKEMICDPGSLHFELRPGSTTDKCLQIHVYREEPHGETSVH